MIDAAQPIDPAAPNSALGVIDRQASERERKAQNPSPISPENQILQKSIFSRPCRLMIKTLKMKIN